MKLQLLVLNKNGINISVFDKKRITVGRASSCDLKIKDRFISRKHFIIEQMGTRYYLTDLGTRNPTFVDGQELKPNQFIYLNDRAKIKIGDSTIEFSIIPKTEDAKEPAAVVTSISNNKSELPQKMKVKTMFSRQGVSNLYSKLANLDAIAFLHRQNKFQRTIISSSFLWVVTGIIILGVGIVFVVLSSNLNKPVNTTGKVNNGQVLVQEPVPPLPAPSPAERITKSSFNLPSWSILPLVDNEEYLGEIKYPSSSEKISTEEISVKTPVVSIDYQPEITIYLKDGKILKAQFLGYQDSRYIIKFAEQENPVLVLDKEINRIVFDKKEDK